ncbi:MAG: hypothetical protein HQM13_03720 [SAR324 cluster bacterium]|nr:hypothetical protein [SAR324 cluster bacterium]
MTINNEQGFLGYSDMDQGKYSFKDDFFRKLDSIISDMRQKGGIKKMVDRFVNSGVPDNADCFYKNENAILASVQILSGEKYKIFLLQVFLF